MENKLIKFYVKKCYYLLEELEKQYDKIFEFTNYGESVNYTDMDPGIKILFYETFPFIKQQKLFDGIENYSKIISNIPNYYYKKINKYVQKINSLTGLEFGKIFWDTNRQNFIFEEKINYDNLLSKYAELKNQKEFNVKNINLMDTKEKILFLKKILEEIDEEFMIKKIRKYFVKNKSKRAKYLHTINKVN